MKIALIFSHFEDGYSIIVTDVDEESSLEPFVGDDDYIVTTDWDGKSLIVFSRNDKDGYIEQLKGVYTKESLEKYSKNIIKKEIQNQLKYLTEEDGLIEDVEFADTLTSINLYDAPNCSPEEVWDLIQNNDLDGLTDIAYEICADWLNSTYIDKDSSSVRCYLDINKDEIVLGGDHNFFIYTLDEYLKEHENEDLEESFKSKDIGGGMENMEKVDFKKCPYCGSSNISVETNPDDTGDITENRFIPVDVYCNDCEKAWMANAEIVLKEFTIYYDKWDEELDEPLSLAEGDVIPTILLDEQGESLEETLFKSNDKYSVLREALDKLDKVYSNKSLKESAVYNYIVRYDGWVEPLYITSVNPFDLGKKKDAYKFNSFDDAFNAWEELCKDPKFRESITNDTDRTIFKLREALDKLDREDGRDKVK